MSSALRNQLTLFTNPAESQAIEDIRKTFNSLQYQLIQSHITLCREHELNQYLPEILDRLRQLQFPVFRLKFSTPVRFANGKGVFIPISDPDGNFLKLRQTLLNGLPFLPEDQEPHLTLLHPRNATCTDSVFETILKMPLPEHLTFNSISLIEQENGNPWKCLSVFRLKH